VPTSSVPVVSGPAVSITSVQPVLRYPKRGIALSPAKLNVIPASKSPAFNVKIRNAGSSPKTNVHVTLVIDPDDKKVTATDTVASIGPHQTAAVLLGDLGEIPQAVRTTLTVSVTGGKTKTYPVIFAAR
jgi:hypothetical protein